MKAMILAGGVGKRMYPVDRSKCLLGYLGKELILHKIDILNRTGIEDLIIVGNQDNIDKLGALLGDEADYAVQKKPRGMADAILSGAGRIDDREVLIINAEDIVSPSGLSDLIQGPGDSRLLGYQVEDYFPGGYFILEGDTICGMVEKPGPGKEPSDIVSIGVYFHRKFDVLLDYLERASSSKDDVYEVAMDMMMKDGYDYRVSRYAGDWLPLKYPWHIQDLKHHFLLHLKEKKIHPSVKIHETAIIEGNVIIEEGSRVFEHAVIRGPCYLGKSSIVGNNSLIWGGCHFGDGCVVGYSTEIKNCYVGNNVWFHQNYVGDSVIMDDCSLGAKTTTANFRFDEKNIRVKVGGGKVDTGRNKFGVLMGERCRTGILVGLMPGVRIGAGSLLGPMVMVSGDVKPGRSLFLDQNHIALDNPYQVKTDRDGLRKKIGGD